MRCTMGIQNNGAKARIEFNKNGKKYTNIFTKLQPFQYTVIEMVDAPKNEISINLIKRFSNNLMRK